MARLRFSWSATHADADIERLAAVNRGIPVATAALSTGTAAGMPGFLVIGTSVGKNFVMAGLLPAARRPATRSRADAGASLFRANRMHEICWQVSYDENLWHRVV